MCRLRSALGLTLLLAVAGATASPADDRVERYLESRGLDVVLAEQLLGRLDGADGRERAELADRLSTIFARLIQEADSPEARSAHRARATELLRGAGGDVTLAMRLRIRRAEYVVGERLAERWRLGLGEARERDEAIAILRAVSEDLGQIGGEADRAALRLQRDEERTPAAERALLASALSEAREARSLSFYLAGWSNAYLADLSGTPGRAEEALRNFGWLLGANPGQPASLARAPVGLFRYDHVARSAIGVGWCHAMLGRGEESASWFDLVAEGEETAATAREVIDLWRVISLASLGDWVGVRTRMTIGEAPEEAMTLVVAALAFDAVAAGGTVDPIARALRDQAIADLLARGRLAQVVSLGRRHGLSSLGDAGFAARCVRGLTLFEEARRDDDEGTRALLRAAEALAFALGAADADQYPSAAGEASAARAQALLLAARRERGGAAANLYAQASEEFERATTLLRNPARVADALYWAVRTIDDAREAGAAVPVARRARLVDALLDRHPDDGRAGLLLVQELSGVERLDDAMIARLQRVGADSGAYDAARRLVARALYDRFLEADAQTHDWAALRYADAAEPILADDVAAGALGDADAAARALTRGRRVLAALLETAAPDAARARRTLALLERLLRTSGAVAPGVAHELLYREAQIAIVEGRMDDAGERLLALVALGSEGARFVEALRATMLRQALTAWENARRERAGRAALVSAAVRAVNLGRERLETLESADRLALQATLAQAAADIWRETGDEAMREQALAWLQEVHNAEILHLGATRLFAELAEASGEIVRARDAWRDLSAALDASSPAWFEARYHLMRLMVATDPETARILLHQHGVLHPDDGPAPWGARIGELRESFESDGAGAES